MKAMLLAAGKSTRLGALGQILPKALVPICGYPVIRFGLAACARAGLRDIVVNLHHQGALVREALGSGEGSGVNVAFSDEPELLGTGGGLAKARPLLGPGPALVMNAKVVADIDLSQLLAAHARSGADATLVLRDDPDARRWGAIAADEDGRVTRILEAAARAAPRGREVERMFTGIQVIGPAILDRLRPVFSDSVRDGYVPALLAGADIRAFVMPGYFGEHSTPERYLAGNLALLRQPDLVPAPPGPLTGVDGGAHVAPDAQIRSPVRIEAGAIIEAGAVVGPEVVVGAGARVLAGAEVTRAVLWPRARAAGKVADTVLAPH